MRGTVAVTLLALGVCAQARAAPAPAGMQADPAGKSVSFQISMGAAGEAGGLNFDGHAHGHMTITVPVGWKVTMTAVNEDSLPHSLEIVPAQARPPMKAVAPAFPRAETIDLQRGLPPNGSDSLSFTADKPGRYWIMCGVPGHAEGGMWDWFVVSATAPTPTITVAR